MTFLELEKLCKKRKRNKILKIILLIVILLSISVELYYVNKEKKVTYISKKEIKDKNITKVIIKQNIKHKEIKKQVLKPIIDLNISVIHKQNTKENNISQNIKTNNKQKKLISSQVLPSYETCIKFANLAYKQGDYQEALKWAKNANIQNNKKPQSWILTAKALYKLGHKKDAIKILKIYYNYHKDEKVKKLIRGLYENIKK